MNGVNSMSNVRGMTLLEIMVVIAIIGILSSAIGVSVVTYMEKAKVDATKAQLRQVANAVELYAVENDWPTDLREVLEAENEACLGVLRRAARATRAPRWAPGRILMEDLQGHFNATWTKFVPSETLGVSHPALHDYMRRIKAGQKIVKYLPPHLQPISKYEVMRPREASAASHAR